MARDTVERQLGEHVYKVTLLGAKAGRAMSVRLLKLLGPALSSFLEGLAVGKDGEQALALGAAEAMRALVKQLTAEDCASIMDELAKATVVVLDAEREPQLDRIFDDHFAGRYDQMLQWFAFALEVNFRSYFLDWLSDRGLLDRVMRLIASASQSPTASTGTSTASPPAATTAQA